MKEISYKEFSEKEVINMSDCKRLGYVCNILIDVECNRITAIIVKKQHLMPAKGECFTIPWECIRKIGDDLICVDFHTPPSQPKPIDKKSSN